MISWKEREEKDKGERKGDKAKNEIERGVRWGAHNMYYVVKKLVDLGGGELKL